MSGGYDGKDRRKNKDDISETVHQAVTKAITEHAKVTPEKHRSDHDWVWVQREKQRQRAEFCDAMKQDLSKWGIKGTISIIIIALLYAFKHWIGALP